MGKRILGWFFAIILFFLVAGVAMLPLEEDMAAQQAEKQPAAVVLQNAAAQTLPAVSAGPSASVSASPDAGVPPEAEQNSSARPEQDPAPQPSEPAVSAPEEEDADGSVQADYILNINSGKFHDPSCPSVGLMNESNKQPFEGTREEAIAQGYQPCQNCSP